MSLFLLTLYFTYSFQHLLLKRDADEKKEDYFRKSLSPKQPDSLADQLVGTHYCFLNGMDVEKND